MALKRRAVIYITAICIAIALIGATFALYRYNSQVGGITNFGKVEIVGSTPFSTTAQVRDAVPGDKLTDTISFTKAVDGEDMYLRAKVWFSMRSITV